jgi:hypothetical protein
MNANGTFTPYGPMSFKKQFMYIEGHEKDTRLDYLASNLAPYLKPVPEAYKTINVYRVCRIANPLLVVAGLATTIGSAAYAADHTEKNEQGQSTMPDLTGVFIGVGISLTSWIPFLMSRGKVEKAVELYNQDSRVEKL